MAALSVSLSEKMKSAVKARVTSGDYHNESEYIRDLIRRDEQRRSKEYQLLSELRAAHQSGTSKRSVKDIMRDVQSELK